MTTQAERVARMEVEVHELKRVMDEHKNETKAQFKEVKEHINAADIKLTTQINSLDVKLDELLVLRNKGLGVFWLLSILVGTGFIGGFWQLMNYLFGKQ